MNTLCLTPCVITWPSSNSQIADKFKYIGSKTPQISPFRGWRYPIQLTVYMYFLFLIVSYDEEHVECSSLSNFLYSWWNCMTACEWRAVSGEQWLKQSCSTLNKYVPVNVMLMLLNHFLNEFVNIFTFYVFGISWKPVYCAMLMFTCLSECVIMVLNQVNEIVRKMVHQ